MKWFRHTKRHVSKISTVIVKNHDIIGIEDLSVKNMLKNHNLAKAISEVSWSQFRTLVPIVVIDTKTLKILPYVNGHAQCVRVITKGILTQVSIFVMKHYD